MGLRHSGFPVRRSPHFGAVLLLGALGTLSPGAFAQEESWRVCSDGFAEELGAQVCEIADITADGFPEILVGDSEFFQPAVWLVDGRTGQRLKRYQRGAGSAFGRALTGLGDLDGDGFPEFAIGEPVVASARGRVTVFSGFTRFQLFRIEGERSSDQLGFAIDNAGDLDGDGVEDLLIGGTGVGCAGERDGAARVYSGADQSVLFEFCEAGTTSFGHTVLGGLDLDGDSIPDLVVSDPTAERNGLELRGLVVAYRGSDGAELFRVWGVGKEKLGQTLSTAGDMNGDGVEDLLAGAPEHDQRRGRVWLIDGATGQRIREYLGRDRPSEYFSLGGVAGGRDIDGDGVPDLLVGAWGAQLDSFVPGSAWLLSGASGRPLYRWYGEEHGDEFGRSVAWHSKPDAELPDALVGARRGGIGGCLHAFSVAGWMLDLAPPLVQTFRSLTYRSGRGAPGALFGIYYTSIDGIPFFRPRFFGLLDAEGFFERSVVVPDGLGEHEIEYIAFTLDAGGPVIASRPATLKILDR